MRNLSTKTLISAIEIPKSSKLYRYVNQSRAQSFPAPRSAVGRQGELWKHRAVPVLVRMLGFEKRKSRLEVITKVSFHHVRAKQFLPPCMNWG